MNKKTNPRTKMREYRIWCGMKDRCFNSKATYFKYYGGRGITVCERWRGDFSAFLSDMGTAPSPEHSIDRKNNDGPYSPENCRWATRKEQANNRRQTSYPTRFITYNGETRHLCEWARILDIDFKLLSQRLRKYPPEVAFLKVMPGLTKVSRSHCRNGHPMSGENLVFAFRDGKPFRRCLTCNRQYYRISNSRKRAARIETRRAQQG